LQKLWAANFVRTKHIKYNKLINTAANSKIYGLIFFIILGGFSFSYYKFQKYEPTVLHQVQDVKGVESTRSPDVPYPQNIEKIGLSRTLHGEQTTYQVSMTKEEVRDFYYSTFQNKRWEVESEGRYDDFIISKYKSLDKLITVIAFDLSDSDKTLVSIEISPR